MNSHDLNTCKYQSTSSAYHGTLSMVKDGSLRQARAAKRPSKCPQHGLGAVSDAWLGGLPSSWGGSGIGMGRRKFHISKELMFFFDGLPVWPFLALGPWTRIHESMIIHVCLAFACCHALVVWPLHAQCCSIQQGGGSSRICRLRRKTRRLRQVGVSVMCWSQLLFQVLYTSSWNCCMAAWMQNCLIC